jgi:hypothetical protein
LSYSHHPLSASIGVPSVTKAHAKASYKSSNKIDESIKDSYLNESFKELEEEEEPPVT